MENKYDEIMARLHFRYLRGDRQAVTTEEDIKECEKELGISLPEDYRAFLMKYGDTTSESGNILVTASGDSSNVISYIEVFYGLGRGVGYNLISIWRQLSDRLPRNVIAIASSPGGEIFLSVNHVNPGIYWWDRESNFSDENTEFLAKDFDCFMQSLKVERER